MIWLVVFILILTVGGFLLLTIRMNKKVRMLKVLLNNTRNKITLGEETGKYVKEHSMGKHSYVCDYFTCASQKTSIGKFCSIADNVTLGTTFHPTDRLTSHPFTYFEPLRLTKNAEQKDFIFCKPVLIGNDVWIGKHVTVLDGITIGDGAVIGTNAVVTHDVPPYAIVVGIPARVLRYRFNEKIIDDLLRLKWWNLDDETIASLPFCDIPACIAKLKQIRGEK